VPNQNLQFSYSDQEYLFDGGGESVQPRVCHSVNGVAAVTQSLRLVGFLCKRTEPVNTIAFITGTTAAAATPTLVRYGLWERSSGRDFYSLVASTPNDLALLAAANTKYPKNVSTPYIKQQGLEYLAGCLVVSAAAMPTFHQNGLIATTVGATELLTSPVRCANLAAQTDLPAIITTSALVVSANTYICSLT